jgi:hypothetical protein
VTITLGDKQRPIAVAVGNFDASQDSDKGLDLVVVTTKASDGADTDLTVQIWKNTTASKGATPTFVQSASKQLANAPRDVVAVYLDGDNNLDVVVAEVNPTTALQQFLGDGAGGLGAAKNTPLIDGVFRVAAVRDAKNLPAAPGQGSFDDGGTNDLVVLFNTRSQVQVVLSNGDGTLDASKSPANLFTSQQTEGLAVGRFFAGDNRFGAVAVTDDQALLLRGDGTGQLFPWNQIVPFTNLSVVAAGDFNNDGLLDFAVTGGTGFALVNVQLGRGDGNFNEGNTVNAGGTVNHIAVGDFNNDGKADLVVVTSDGKARVLLNNTDLTASAIPIQALESQQFTAVTAQFSVPDMTAGPENFSALIDWGDGTTSTGTIARTGALGTPFTVTGTHTYAPEGTYRVFVQIIDNKNGIGIVTAGQASVLESRPAGITDATQHYVDELYEKLLGRRADAAGLALYSGALARGVSRDLVVQAILLSQESLVRLVTDAYVLCLNRLPDDSGLVNGVNMLAQGLTLQQLRALLLASPEFFGRFGGGTNEGFLSALYRRVLNREIEPAAQATYLRQLSVVNNRGLSVVTVLNSTEFLTKLLSTGFNFGNFQLLGHYVQYLNRFGDAVGLNSAINAIQHGSRESTFIIGLFTSPEFVARLQ